jgi:hypothetical protein
MSKQSEKVKRWRKTAKQRIIDAMGGECCICGYNKCHSALALHHLNPAEKDFSFGKMRANPKNWDTIVKELRKCILLCHNCHHELHEGITTLPFILPSFNEQYADYKLAQRILNDPMEKCSTCNKMKSIHTKYCSLQCAGKSKYKVPWDNIDLQLELQSKSILQLADEVGCSDTAIHKRLKKLGLK